MVALKRKRKRLAEDGSTSTSKTKALKPNTEDNKSAVEDGEPFDKVEKLVTEDVDKNNTKKSKTKTQKTSDFDVKYFRKQLNMKPAQLVSLSQFAEICLKSNSTTDYMTLYLEAGGNANEILKILDYQNKKNPAISTPVFIILQLLFSKVQSSSPQYFQAAEETCRYFLNSYVSTIDFTLSEKASSKQQKTTLRLLTSIVALSPELGFTVLNQLSLQPKTLVHLVKNLNAKEKDDVRASYIDFVLAFLDGNTPLIKSALDKQGLITLIIPGLVRDNSETVLMVLETFTKNIINNLSISKTIKIRTFNQNMILSIFNLFNWSESSSLSEEEKISIKKEVEDVVFNFLFVLCTSHKHGIYFTDFSLGTSDLPTSQYLWKALESLEAPWNNEKAGQLIIQMVSKCPDLYRPVIRLVEQSFDPRNSEIWFKTTNFLMNLLRSLPAKHVVNSMNNMNATQITNFVRNVYLPIPILKMSLSALSMPDDAVRNQIVILLHVMLSSIKSYLVLLGIKKNNVMVILKIRLEDFIPKHFPSTDILITVLHSMLDNNSASQEKVTEESKPTFKIPLPNQSRLLINVLDLLLLYNDVLPNSLDPISTMLDSKRLFDKMELIDETDKGELKLKITMFLLCADKFAFVPDKPLFKKILQSMFEVFIASDLSISEASRNVLYSILETTGIFEKSRSEIDLLLSIIHYVGSKYGQSTAEDIVNVVEKVNKHSDKYISKLTTSSAEEENAEGLIKHFDALIENFQYCYEHTIDENIIFEKSFLTHFVVGLLENFKSKSSKSSTLLTNLYIIHLLHYQDSAENIWHILENYKVDASVKNYIMSWKSQPIVFDIDFIDESTVLYRLNKALLSHTKMNLETVFDPEDSGNIQTDNKLITEQNISCLSEKESELFSWFNMILFYVTQQGSLGILDECKVSNATRALCHVLMMSKGDGSYSTKVLRSMIGNCLSHKVLLKNFSPFKKQKHTSEHLSDFVLEFVRFCNDNSIEKSMVDSLLRPYRHNIFLSLLAQLKKSSKNKKGQTLPKLSEILSTVNLDFSDATLIIIDILKMDVGCMVSEENEASSWVYVLCHVINQFIKHSRLIPTQLLQGIAVLYSKMITGLDLVINITDFEESFYNYLVCNPETLLSVPASAFEAIFSVKHVSKWTSKIGSLLLKVNVNLLPKFSKKVIQPEILDKRELVLPLTTAAFCHYKFNSNNSEIIQKIYDNYKSNIQKVMEKPHKASQIYIDNSDLIVKLINACMDTLDCETYFKKIHKFDTVEIFHLDILEAIFLKACSDGLVNNYSNNYLLCILQLANIALKRDIPQYGKLNRLASCLKQFLLVCDTKDLNIFTSVRENAIWQNFFKSTLKYYLQTEMKEPVENSECNENETALFGVLSCLIRLIYPDEDKDILNLFEMTSSHSEFLNIMLSNRHVDVKTHLVKLLFVMVSKNKEIMKSAHITVYLSAYHGSLNMCDRYLLALLRFYERNGQPMTEFQPYLWGDTAANHYAVRSKRTKSSLWSNPTANHILNLLDKEMIEKTVRHFPTHKILDVEEDLFNSTDCLFGISKNDMAVNVDNVIEDSLRKKHGKGSTPNCDKLTLLTGEMKLKEYKLVFSELVKTENSLQQDAEITDSEIYDPAFLMPLLNFVVTPGSAVSCHRIIRGGVLAIPLVALSSSCPLIRGVALNILQRFYALLESEMYYRNDKVLWSQFIDTLKSSMETALPASDSDQKVDGLLIPRLPAVGALYLARSALIMTHPLDPMFKPINNFIISKQYINFSVVPDLLDLFHNTDIQFMERRTWMLKILRDGVKTFADVKVLLKSVAFKIILDFYSSNLSDIKQKLLVLEILNSCIRIPKAAKILTEGYGLFAWLSCSVKNIHFDNKSLISMAITLISNLWMSLACERLPKVPNIMDIKYQENVFDSINSRCFKIGENLQCSLLCLLLDLLNKISGASVSDVKTYLNVLRKISKSSINNISKPQILMLLRECNILLNIQKMTSILVSVIETSKIGLLYSSFSVLDVTTHDSEDKHLIVKYLHEICMTWVS